MNNLLPARVAENCCNFTALVPGDQPDVSGGIGREAAPGLDAGAGADHDAIAALEGALDADDAGRQETLAAAERTSGAVIDDQHAGWIDGGGDPGLARRARLAVRQEQCRAGARLDPGKRAPHPPQFRPA